MKFILKILLIQIALLFLHSVSEASTDLIFRPKQRSVKSILNYDDSIFIGTSDGIFLSKDKGKTWSDFGSHLIQEDENGRKNISWIVCNIGKNEIYAATDFGLFKSNLLTPDWIKIFEGSLNDSRIINSILLIKDELFVSSNDGLWTCNIETNICKEKNINLSSDYNTGNIKINNVFYDEKNNDFYISTSTGITHLSSNGTSEELSKGIDLLPDGSVNAKYLFKDKNNTLWLATGTGVYNYSIENNLWVNKSGGLKQNNEGFIDANYLSYFGDNLCSSTSRGVFCLKDKNWSELNINLMSIEGIKNVYQFTEIENKLYICTDNGLYLYEIDLEKENKNNLNGEITVSYLSLDEGEPSITEVQIEALKFSALPTNKDFKRYALQSRFRNLLPKFNLSYNNTDTFTNSLKMDLGLSSNTDFQNDLETSKSMSNQNDKKDFKQFLVEWNTNNLLYDSEIKDLIGQARLTANIRENLLDDITRIYFDRRKLQLESLINPPKSEEEKLRSELQLAELTGQIDSRTGGWFSKEITKRKNKAKFVRENNDTQIL